MIGAERRTIHAPSAAARRSGFTLLEMVVVLGVFSVTVAAATDIFMMSSRAQRRALFTERSQADARFAVEAVVREIRNDKIDYDFYGGAAPAWSDKLALIDDVGSHMLFELSGDANANLCADGLGPCLLVTVDGSTPAAITPKGVRVRNLRFYLAPAVDHDLFNPVTQGYYSDLQQRITVVMTVENPNAKEGEQVATHVQATATGRQYSR